MANTDSSAPAQPSAEEKKLKSLEERLRHELMDSKERCELLEHLRRRLSY
jgi:hypothetical protein